MTENENNGSTGKEIFLDRDFNKMINDNAQAAWLEYCKLNSIDPDIDMEDAL